MPLRLLLDASDIECCNCPICQSSNVRATSFETFAGPILQCDECGEHYFPPDSNYDAEAIARDARAALALAKAGAK